MKGVSRTCDSACFRTRSFNTITMHGRALAVSMMLLLSAATAWGQAEEAATSSGCGQNGAFQGLASFGPLNENGYPGTYTDQNGVALDLCDETLADDPLCGNPGFGEAEGLPFDAPPSVASGNFWHETFYFLANATLNYTGRGALLVLAIEGVFDNAAEDIIDGDQLVFSRIRVRADVINSPESAGTYTVTHPFGVDTFEVTAADITGTGGTRTINFTDDCLHKVVNGVITPTCGVAIGDQFTNPLDATRSRISHYLTWDQGAPAGYIGNPAQPHAVTGSPCGTNVFRVEGPGIPNGSVETSDFLLQGRYAANAAVCGNGAVETGEACDDGNLVDGDCCSSSCTVNNGGTCSDGINCTTDTCSGGACTSSPTVCPDLGLCTDEFCNQANGLCSATAVTCNDNDPCTVDSCSLATGCSNVAITCPGSDICTGGICLPDPCVPNGTCEAGETCDNCAEDCASGAGAVCDNGVCETADGEDCVSCPADCNGVQDGLVRNRFCCGDGDGRRPVGCGDSRCTAGGNTCDATTAASCCGDGTCTGGENLSNCAVDCLTTCSVDADCADANACTVGVCDAGACINTQLNCNDGNACTVDGCSASTGCTHNNLNCNDGNSCTADSCNVASGCVNAFPSCGLADSCCSPGCTPEADQDCANCGLRGTPCVADSDCCSNSCKGKVGAKTCKK